MRFHRSFTGMAFAFWKVPRIRHPLPPSTPPALPFAGGMLGWKGPLRTFATFATFLRAETSHGESGSGYISHVDSKRSVCSRLQAETAETKAMMVFQGQRIDEAASATISP
jgi:hypothetical protein